jgi:hypothetical protein
MQEVMHGTKTSPETYVGCHSPAAHYKADVFGWEVTETGKIRNPATLVTLGATWQTPRPL